MATMSDTATGHLHSSVKKLVACPLARAESCMHGMHTWPWGEEDVQAVKQWLGKHRAAVQMHLLPCVRSMVLLHMQHQGFMDTVAFQMIAWHVRL
jgi:hypothetical protein